MSHELETHGPVKPPFARTFDRYHRIGSKLVNENHTPEVEAMLERMQLEAQIDLEHFPGSYERQSKMRKRLK